MNMENLCTRRFYGNPSQIRDNCYRTNVVVVLVVWAEYEKLVGLHLFGPVQWPVTELFECFYI